MAVDVFRVEDGAIEFWKENTVFMLYDLSITNQQKGLAYWLNRLSEKQWFDDEARQTFIAVWNAGFKHE